MSAVIAANADWLRYFPQGLNVNQAAGISIGGWVKLVVDGNAIQPVIMVNDGAGTIYGLYTNATGTDCRLSYYDGSNPSAAIASPLVVGTWVPVALVMYLNAGVFTLRGFVNGAYVDFTGFAAMALFSYQLATDFVTHLKSRWCDTWGAKVAYTPAQIAALHASSAPWTVIGDTDRIGQGSFRGATVDQGIGTMVPAFPGSQWSSGILIDADNVTYATALTGSTTLDIAA